MATSKKIVVSMILALGLFAGGLQAQPTVTEPPTLIRADCNSGCTPGCWDQWDTDKAACNGDQLCKWRAFNDFCTCVYECGCPLEPNTLCNQQ